MATEKNQETKLDVSVYWSPLWGKETFKTKALAVSSKNKLGNFDILPYHTNFITMIFDTLTIKTEKEEIRYNFKRGVLEVSENVVSIFLGL
jgi:F0F1-type ATP synthase epsilon subunit